MHTSHGTYRSGLWRCHTKHYEALGKTFKLLWRPWELPMCARDGAAVMEGCGTTRDSIAEGGSQMYCKRSYGLLQNMACLSRIRAWDAGEWGAKVDTFPVAIMVMVDTHPQ